MMGRWSDAFSTLLCLLGLVIVAFLPTVVSLTCYQCTSSDELQCGETLEPGTPLEPAPCNDLNEASYCVKMTGVFAGGHGIQCYECKSWEHWGCIPRPKDMRHLQPFLSNCSHVHDAQFCLKATGVIGGELGTTRFCSSRDFGNFCEFVRRPGDPREYRACTYTCQTDACNSSPYTYTPPPFISLFLLLICIPLFS